MRSDRLYVLSATLFDYQFDVAHLLKIASYICMLVGLPISFYATFRQTNELGQRLRAFVNNTVDGVITVNHHGTIETVKPAVVGMFGYPADELLGRNVSLLLSDDDRENCRDGQSQIDQKMTRLIDQTRELSGQRKDGSAFPIELTISELEYDGKTRFAGIVRDITDRKRSEKLKNEFVSTVSHELWTPLTSIKGALPWSRLC
jgi:PAS domain S-box-containing protein